MTHKLYAPSIILLGVMLSACASTTKVAEPGPQASSPSGDVTLVTDSSSYHPGDEIRVELRNGTSQQVGYNLCFAFLSFERRSDDGRWTSQPADLGPGGSTACTSELRLMQAGGSASGTAYLPKSLAPGTYRLTQEVEIRTDNPRQKIATEGFAVVP